MKVNFPHPVCFRRYMIVPRTYSERVKRFFVGVATCVIVVLSVLLKLRELSNSYYWAILVYSSSAFRCCY